MLQTAVAQRNFELEPRQGARFKFNVVWLLVGSRAGCPWTMKAMTRPLCMRIPAASSVHGRARDADAVTQTQNIRTLTDSQEPAFRACPPTLIGRFVSASAAQGSLYGFELRCFFKFVNRIVWYYPSGLILVSCPTLSKCVTGREAVTTATYLFSGYLLPL